MNIHPSVPIHREVSIALSPRKLKATTWGREVKITGLPVTRCLLHFLTYFFLFISIVIKITHKKDSNSAIIPRKNIEDIETEMSVEIACTL
jgi:hypothetical protein